MAAYYWVGGSGTWNNASTTNWAIVSGGVGGFGPPMAVVDSVTFDSNSGTAATVTVASTAACGVATINKSDIVLSLSGNVMIAPSAGFITFTTGTISLNTYTLTTGTLASNNSNTRAINFGSGSKVIINGPSGALWQCNVLTGFSYTGTSRVEFPSLTGAITIRNGNNGGGVEANSMSFYFQTGSANIDFAGFAKTLDYTGFSGTSSNTVRTIYGDLVGSSGMTWTAGANAITFAATSGTQQITSSAKTFDFPVTINGVGTTVQIQDALTMGSSRTLTLTNGTLDLKNLTLTTGLFSSTNSNARVIAFGTGNITLIGSGTVWNTGTVTNFSYTGTPTVNVSNNSATATTVSTGTFTETQALTFNYTVGTYTLTDTSSVYKSLNFTGFTGVVPNSARTIYGNLTIVSGATNSAGANATTFGATSGTQQITTNAVTLDYPLTFNGVGGTFAFQDALTQGSTRAFTITNGTVQLKASATSTVGAFTTSGSTQKNLQSTTSGTKATLSQASGTVSASYLTIRDIAATGGAVWNAYTTSNNIDAGNNSGWDFSSQTGRYIYTRRKNKRILP